MLAPCPSCARHVRVSETACPFCHAAIPEGITPVPGTNKRLSRAAAYAFTATMAATSGAVVVACGATAQPAYGGPGIPSEGGSTDGASDGATDADAGGAQPAYGAPAYGAQPVDSGDG